MRARFAVLSVALFLSACGGQDPVSSLPADSVSAEPAAKVFSAPVAATCERCAPKEQASIFLNYVRVHATASNPTGVVGATDVILGTYAVHLPAGAVVQAFGLYSRLDGSGFALADVFQNLQQIDAFGHVIGETIGTLGAPDVQQHSDTAGYGLGSHLDLGEPPYVFIPTPDYGLDNIPRFYEMWVYADIKSDVSDEVLAYINGLEGGVVTPVVSVRLPNGRRQIIYLENGLQRVHIVQHGRLEVRADGMLADLLLPNFGDHKFVVSRFFLRALDEDIKITSLPFLVPEGAVSPWVLEMHTFLRPLDYYQAWTDQMYPGIVMHWAPLPGLSEGDIIIPAGEEISVYFLAQAKGVGGLPDIPAGSTLQMDLVAGVGNAVGLASGDLISTPAAFGFPRPVIGE